jgi:hypothetical protein
LTARRHVLVLHRLEGLHPVVAEAEFARRPLHLRLAPGVLAVPDLDQLLRRIRDHLARQVLEQALAADGITHDFVVCGGRLGRLPPAPAAAASSRARDHRHGRRRAGKPADLLAQQRGVGGERLRRRLVRRRDPLGERRVVAIVENEPLLQRTAQGVDTLGGAHAHGRRHARRLRTAGQARLERGLRLLHLRAQRTHRGQRIVGRDEVELLPVLGQLHDGGGKRHQRRDVAITPLLAAEQRLLVLEVGSQQHVVGLALLRELREIDRGQRVQPCGLELAQAASPFE